VPPAPDPSEFPSLEAYARYRIAILYLSQGYEKDAKIVYDALLEKFPEGSAGYLYAEMARILWENFQETADLGLACQPVKDYVALQPDIMDPLIGAQRALQGHNYVPEDLCPIEQ
jgi:hypothetical protein